MSREGVSLVSLQNQNPTASHSLGPQGVGTSSVYNHNSNIVNVIQGNGLNSSGIVSASSNTGPVPVILQTTTNPVMYPVTTSHGLSVVTSASNQNTLFATTTKCDDILTNGPNVSSATSNIIYGANILSKSDVTSNPSMQTVTLSNICNTQVSSASSTQLTSHNQGSFMLQLPNGQSNRTTVGISMPPLSSINKDNSCPSDSKQLLQSNNVVKAHLNIPQSNLVGNQNEGINKSGHNSPITVSKALISETNLLKNKNDIGLNNKETVQVILEYLKKCNYKDTVSILKKEALIEEKDKGTPSSTENSNILSSYKSEGDPNLYQATYNTMKDFIDTAWDMYKSELSTLLFPVFIHMYLELVYNGHEDVAKNFFNKFHKDQENYHEADLRRLSNVTKKEHMLNNNFVEDLRSSKYVIRISRDTYTFLRRRLQEKHENQLINIIQENLYFDLYDGLPRSKQQVEATQGSLEGEAKRSANEIRVYHGLLKEPELPLLLDDDEEDESEERPKKKKLKRDFAQFKQKNDPNSPSIERVPLPELRDVEKMQKIITLKESLKRIRIGANHLPSICMYTVLNANQGVTCATISDDSSLMGVGFSDSVVQVWSLLPTKLRPMKSASELTQIDVETEDVLERMMDNRQATDSIKFLGHSGPVYSVSFSPDKRHFISCSEDTTIRLWSLLTWTSIVCYKGHMYPIWDVKFSPHGHYFASSGMDRTARLWSVDHYQPLRIFAGHWSDIDCLQFHPNSNYIATGSSDRTVRLWDVVSGNCVRFMTGHKGAVQTLAFSPDGRFLASSGVDKRIILWDIATGSIIADLKGHTNTIYSLAFSRENAVLASGGIDSNIKLWDVHKLFKDIQSDDICLVQNTVTKNEADVKVIGSFPTKYTPVVHLHFTQRNVLLAAGMFNHQKNSLEHNT